MLEESKMYNNQIEIEKAMEFFDPRNFGFSEIGQGWAKEFPGLGEAIFSPLTWGHVNQISFTKEDPYGQDLLKLAESLGIRFPDDKREFNIFEFLSLLQAKVWMMGAFDVVPPNVFSIITKTGGSIIAAYQKEKGFTPEGWLGFIFCFGSNNISPSHMMGVRDDLRGKNDIGFNLKILQAFEALRSGFATLSWTFDPARGPNAYFNIEKLGATANKFVQNMYGELNSGLYGKVPTDRLVVEWKLTDPYVQERIREVHEGGFKKKTLGEYDDVKIVNPNNVEDLLRTQPRVLLFEIPGDIDELTKTEEGKEKAINFRQNMRLVLSQLMDFEKSDSSTDHFPHLLNTERREGLYDITGVISEVDQQGRRENYYVLNKK